jgi:phosphate acetyltransferase
VCEKIPEKNRVILDCVRITEAGDVAITGKADVIAPTQKVRRPRAMLPEVHLHARASRRAWTPPCNKKSY